MSENNEPFTHCEGCSSPISEGDYYHAGNDVDLCVDCAPDYADLLANPESFVDSEGNPISAEVAHQIYHAHIAAGGEPADKYGLRS